MLKHAVYEMLLLFYRYKHFKKFYPTLSTQVISGSNQINANGNDVSPKDNLELKETSERPVFLSQAVLLSDTDEPEIQQTSFCEYTVIVYTMGFISNNYSGVH